MTLRGSVLPGLADAGPKAQLRCLVGLTHHPRGSTLPGKAAAYACARYLGWLGCRKRHG